MLVRLTKSIGRYTNETGQKILPSEDGLRTDHRRSSTAPLVKDAGRRGRRPLRSSIGEWCVGAGVPDGPNRAYTAPLAKPHVIAKPVRTLAVAIRSPRPLCRGITDSHDQSADWSRNDTQILSASVIARAQSARGNPRPPSPWPPCLKGAGTAKP